MQRKRLILVALIGMSVLGLAACYESPDITLHEPGEYKGKIDPLVAASGSTKLDEELRNRLLEIQTDR